MERVQFGSYTSSIQITKAKNIRGIIDIRAGKNHVIALKNTGEVYASGSNLYGQLGRNSVLITRTKEFIKVPNVENAVMIGTGEEHSLALDLDRKSLDMGIKCLQTIRTK